MSEQSRFLTQKEVSQITAIPRASLYDKIGRGEFPRPIKVGVRMSRWSRREVEAWCDAMEARLWGLHMALERGWDGADPGVETDLEALRLAAEVFEAIDPPEVSEPGRLAPAELGHCTESLNVIGPPRGDR